MFDTRPTLNMTTLAELDDARRAAAFAPMFRICGLDLMLAGQDIERDRRFLRPPAPALADPPVPDDVTRCRWRRWLARDLSTLAVVEGR